MRQGKVETLLLWPLPGETVLEGVRQQSYRNIDIYVVSVTYPLECIISHNLHFFPLKSFLREVSIAKDRQDATNHSINFIKSFQAEIIKTELKFKLLCYADRDVDCADEELGNVLHLRLVHRPIHPEE